MGIYWKVDFVNSIAAQDIANDIIPERCITNSKYKAPNKNYSFEGNYRYQSYQKDKKPSLKTSVTDKKLTIDNTQVLSKSHKLPVIGQKINKEIYSTLSEQDKEKLERKKEILESQKKEERLRKKQLEKIKATPTPEKKEKSLRIIKSAMMSGEENYLKIRNQEISKGFVSNNDVDELYKKWKDFMPGEKYEYGNSSQWYPDSAVNSGGYTGGNHDPYRNSDLYNPFIVYSTTDGQ